MLRVLTAILDLLICRISVLGVGVTEAGLASKDTTVIRNLYELLHLFCVFVKEGTWALSTKLCVLDMDNVPNNGDLIQTYMQQHASDDSEMQTFLKYHVVFMNTMVDRITSHREGNPMIPKCEPTPMKALVVLDIHGDLPEALSKQPGVIVRSTAKQLQADIALKLRIANGTHTAIAHFLALRKHLKTDILSQETLYMKYLDTLVQDQIIPGAFGMQEEAPLVYQDWRQRLIHPHFGLSSFFITQNGTSKGGIRWGPTVVDLIQHEKPLTLGMAFAYAVLLRWLTPVPGVTSSKDGVYVGWLDGIDPKSITTLSEDDAEQYADGLGYNLKQGWYEYKCPLQINDQAFPKLLSGCIGKQPAGCVSAVKAYLVAPQGGALADAANDKALDELVQSIATLYARLIAGDGVEDMMKDFAEPSGNGIGFQSPCSSLTIHSGKTPVLHYKPETLPDASKLMNVVVDMESVKSVVYSEVQSVIAIDLHTHLLPPTHGSLCLWGIDELLSYVSRIRERFSCSFYFLSP